MIAFRILCFVQKDQKYAKQSKQNLTYHKCTHPCWFYFYFIPFLFLRKYILLKWMCFYFSFCVSDFRLYFSSGWACYWFWLGWSLSIVYKNYFYINFIAYIILCYFYGKFGLVMGWNNIFILIFIQDNNKLCYFRWIHDIFFSIHLTAMYLNVCSHF